LTQALGVGAFILMASQAGRINDRISPARAIQMGAWMHVGLCSTFLAIATAGRPDFAFMLAFWMAFCAVLAVRGPAAFSEALAVPALVARYPQPARDSAG